MESIQEENEYETLSTTPGTQYELIQVCCVMIIFVIILIIIAHEARLGQSADPARNSECCPRDEVSYKEVAAGAM